MDWFSILKNQVASTKGKQFQLDFTQPMVEEEEENCKEKLIKLARSLEKTNSIEGFPIVSEEITSERKAIYFMAIPNRTRPNIHLVAQKNLKEVPEEVCCEAIQEYNNLGNNDIIFNKQSVADNSYNITVIKGFLTDSDSSLPSTLTDDIRIASQGKFHYIAQIRGFFDEIEEVESTHEKLARRYFNL